MQNQRRGFTLIEMLVVVAIIGVLASIALISFTGTQKQSRDTRRKSDLRLYTTALAEFASKNEGHFPSRTTIVGAADALCNDLSMTNCPEDPKYIPGQNSLNYKYISDGPGSGAPKAKQYVLWGTLENVQGYWVFCSNGASLKVDSEPSTFVCPTAAGGAGSGPGL